jgi:C-terminal processing protease CtpA/Prc
MRIVRTLLCTALLSALPAHAGAADSASAADAQAKAREELRQAQDELRALTRRIAELSAKVGGAGAEHAFAFRYLSEPDRAMIGIVLGYADNAVELAAVTPGGPAEKAGLRAGDRIVSINGKAVADAAKASGPVSAAIADEAAVDAARALIGELKAGDSVRIEYERGGKRDTVTVAAERRESWNWPLIAGDINERMAQVRGLREGTRIELPQVNSEQIQVIVEKSMDGARDAIDAAMKNPKVAEAMQNAEREMRRVMVFSGQAYDLRMAPVDAELGRYFGASEGVLVLGRGDNAPAELKSGDVLLSVGGTRVESSTDVMRALARAEPGSAVNVELLRDRQRQVVVLTVPERRHYDFVLPPPPPSPPVPPPTL